MALDMHLKLEGGTVTYSGSSKHKGHPNEIPVLAWSWGMSQSGSFQAGEGNAGKANIQDISFTKYVDKSSGQFIKAVTTGSKSDTATLTMSQAGGTQQDFIILKLTNVMVTSYSTGCSAGEDTPTENITLTFAKFSFDHHTDGKSDGITEYDMLEVSGK